MLSGEWFYMIGILISLKIIMTFVKERTNYKTGMPIKEQRNFFFLSSNYHRVSKNMTNMIRYKAGLFLYNLSLRLCFFFCSKLQNYFKMHFFLNQRAFKVYLRSCCFLYALEWQMTRMYTAGNHNHHPSKNSLTSNQSK